LKTDEISEASVVVQTHWLRI